jgi:subtilisin family serine protease
VKSILAAAALALALAGPASGARYAVGLQHGADVDAVAARIEAQTGAPVSRLTPFALVANAPVASTTPGISYVEHLQRDRVLAFKPNDPMLAKQWYIAAIHAFDAWPTWPVRPTLGSVKVAIIDSGVDASHPELADRIDASQSFVPDSPNPLKDSIGHGTFVAGLIAAQVNNGTGIAGIGFSARLLVAKVVRSDGTISPEAEARAIRWAANNGARVINLSLAALRDPGDPSDEYSPLEAAAVQYAVSKGALVVAAVGNGEGATKLPWRWASYPAALPHVLGVSAAAQDGSIPDFSNGDPLYDDIAAPGMGILSTVPRDLSTDRPQCQGYSTCGPDDFRHGDGTSFAAAEVSAAAAQLMAANPDLQADQVEAILERSADDMTTSDGCKRCSVGRDDASGWGMLDVQGAYNRVGLKPAPDSYEPNDEVGTDAYTPAPGEQVLKATLDAWDDPNDVYRVFLKEGQQLGVGLITGTTGASVSLLRPGTRSITLPGKPLAQRSAASGKRVGFKFRATDRGWYFVDVTAATAQAGTYTLKLRR